MIKRDVYLQELIAFRGQPVIKVVTGVRRCGKSTLFQLYQDYLHGDGVLAEQIISINLEDLAHEDLLDYKVLYAYITERLSSKGTYVFIDEVQQCASFEKVVDSLILKENVDVYITGSNAHMLSGELATLLSGRYVAIDMLPLSFAEYYGAHNLDNTQAQSLQSLENQQSQKSPKNLDDLFHLYISYGSFPYVTELAHKLENVNAYLEGIYNTIIVKDIAQRAGIKDITLLKNIVRTLVSSIGSSVSTKKISDTINSSGRKVSVNTVDMYIKALTDSYIFYKADRYDVKGRQYLKTQEKYYLVDTGLRRLLLTTQSQDLGHIIENIVYLELLRRGYEVSIGKVGAKEVDFVAKKMDSVHYFQVSASVLDENTLKRELAPFEAINDNFPKTLLTLDKIGVTSHNGIEQTNLIDWLLCR